MPAIQAADSSNGSSDTVFSSTDLSGAAWYSRIYDWSSPSPNTIRIRPETVCSSTMRPMSSAGKYHEINGSDIALTAALPMGPKA